MAAQRADALRSAAAELRQEILDAFERQGAKHAMKMWSKRLHAELLLTQARIVENGCRAEAVGLYYHNRRVAARLVETKWGKTWLLRKDEVRRFGRRRIPFDGKGTSRIQQRFRMSERPETIPIWARLAETDKGLDPDDCATAHVVVYRSGDPWGLDARPHIQSERTPCRTNQT